MRRHVSFLLAALVLTPAVAFAGDSKAESDRLFREGLRLFEQKNFDAARAKFADAYGKFPSPNSLLNLARSEQLSDHCVDAVAHYRAYIALPPNPRIATGDRGAAVLKLNECYAKIGRIEVHAPVGAHVTIDGLAIAWTPGEPVDVAPGPHRVELGVGTETKTRVAAPVQGEVASVQWDEPPPPEPVKPVEPPPAPPVAPPPPPVVAQPAPTPTEPPIVWKTTTRWPTVKVAGAIGLGVFAIGSFIAGPSFLAASLSSARSADALAAKLGASGCANASTPECVTLQGERSDQSTFGALSATFFVLGTLAVVGSVVVMLAVHNLHPVVRASLDGVVIRF